jgi:hypothetical protein
VLIGGEPFARPRWITTTGRSIAFWLQISVSVDRQDNTSWGSVLPSTPRRGSWLLASWRWEKWIHLPVHREGPPLPSEILDGERLNEEVRVPAPDMKLANKVQITVGDGVS